MSTLQLPLAAAQLHFNQQLFSDYYLDQILPQHTDWRLLIDEAAAVLVKIRAIYAGFTPSSIEAQTEDDLIKPVLAALGHSFEVQAALKTPDGTKKPDYVFYRDLPARDANKGRVLDDALPAQAAFAVGDAKYWDRPLDVALKLKTGDPFTNRNPGYQIAFYIQHSGLEWGILTNGRRWRLYHKETAHKLDRFYEVDLPSLLERNDPAAFLYFYAFFRRAAFEVHPLGLGTLLQASSDFARGISENIKQQVYTALRHVAQGFLDYAPNALRPDPATLKLIYDHSLIVLYRLLFVLYAEARELLPLRESAIYRHNYSLDAIKRKVAENIDSGLPLLTSSAIFWIRLYTLFGLIDKGEPHLKISTFNGGLFDPSRYPFLDQHSIGDAHLLQALDLLTRVKRQFVDYRDLAERHLGTIYEGLLEYHLAALAPPGATPTDGQVARNDEDAGFMVALVNSEGERHRTGSYYTPDFVVYYIIDQTLRPLLDAAVADQTSDQAKVAAVLALNVLDPSMGSGHFPVAATEYIARYLIDLGITALEEDAAAEPDLAYWKRRVAQNCIYGVDLNPLAVDLAKLSLWLSTAAKDKPLSFLDHHLRCGNAVVGVRLSDLDLSGTAPTKRGPSKKTQAAVASGQLSMLDDHDFTRSMSTAVDSMWLIERSAGNTLAEVKEQEQTYQVVRAELSKRYAHIADLATAAQGFGLAVDRTLWPELVRQASRGHEALMLPAITRLLAQAAAMAEAQRFFHWDLEFPEVFFDRFGRPLGEKAGFDALIGNPPYVRQEQIAPYKGFLAAAFSETYHGAADLFVYFYHQGLRLLRSGGRLSYIVTNKWLRSGYGEALRGYFTQHTRIERLIDFGHAPIFADADVFPCIIVLEKPAASDATSDTHTINVTAFPREALKLHSIADYEAAHSYPVPQIRLRRSAWSLETAEIEALMAKIRRAGVPLTEFAGIKPYRGVLTGFNEAFLIDTATKERLIREDPRSAEIIKPYLRGQDIKRWSPEWDGVWLIFTGHGVEISNYPAILTHLTPFRAALERRAGSQEWWQTQATTAFHHLFAQPKLMYQEIQYHSRYCFDNQGFYGNNKTFLIPTGNLWLLAVLNSPLMWWHNWRFLPHMKDEALNPAGFLMEQLPIAPASDAIRAEIEPAVTRLIAITQAEQEARRDTLDWLRSEFGVEQAGQKLENFASLSADEFIAEVKKRRPKGSGATSCVTTPATLKALRTGYNEQVPPVQARAGEALGLERRIAALVNSAYGLSPEDVELLWRSAPPRMPVGRGER
nr:Eco57I restriction-modification methylase domain-containing protein [Candidatus Oscillochloris fontis]